MQPPAEYSLHKQPECPNCPECGGRAGTTRRITDVPQQVLDDAKASPVKSCYRCGCVWVEVEQRDYAGRLWRIYRRWRIGDKGEWLRYPDILPVVLAD